MADLNEQDAATLSGDLAEMQKAGMSQADMEAYADEFASAHGMGPKTEQPLGKLGLSGSQTAALMAGPAIGGTLGASAGAGRNVFGAIPKAWPVLRRLSGGLGRLLTQYGGEALGIMGGDVAGRAVARVPQNPQETVGLGLGGAGIGTAVRGLTQFGGMVGGVPKAATRGAAEPVSIPLGKLGRIPLPIPQYESVSEAAPHSFAEVKAGISAEDDLAVRAGDAAYKANQTITGARLEKMAIIKAGDQSGVRVPVEPIRAALRKHKASVPAMEISDYRLLNAKIDQAINMLDKAAPTGTLQPSEVDDIIRKVLRPKAFTGTGKPSTSMFGEALGDAEMAATNELNKWLPGDLAAKNAEISQRLTDTENAVRIFGDPDKAGVTAKISSAFGPNNESTARALKLLSLHDSTLSDDAIRLWAQRQFAGDIRTPPMGSQSGFFGTVIRKPSEAATRVIAPWQRVAGGISAGVGRKPMLGLERFLAPSFKSNAQWAFKKVHDALVDEPTQEQQFPGLTNAPQQEKR